jgi:hypothetical protein
VEGHRVTRRLQLVPPDGPSVTLPSVEDIDALAQEQLPGVIAELAALQARAAMRLRTETPAGRDEDALLTIEEAAARLAVTEDWIRRRPELPFVVKLSEGVVCFGCRVSSP